MRPTDETYNMKHPIGFISQLIRNDQFEAIDPMAFPKRFF
jgi:hypothetical protein